MKFIFKVLVRMHVFFCRLTGGRFGGKIQSFPVLLLTTTGRKTGKPHTTALGYFEDAGASRSASAALGALDRTRPTLREIQEEDSARDPAGGATPGRGLTLHYKSRRPSW